MAEKPKRIYLPIWERLKLEGKCFVPCFNKQRDRVIKAVTKEKYMDRDAIDKGYGRLEHKKHKHGVAFEIMVPISKELF